VRSWIGKARSLWHLPDEVQGGKYQNTTPVCRLLSYAITDLALPLQNPSSHTMPAIIHAPDCWSDARDDLNIQAYLAPFIAKGQVLASGISPRPCRYLDSSEHFASPCFFRSTCTSNDIQRRDASARKKRKEKGPRGITHYRMMEDGMIDAGLDRLPN